MLCTHFLAVNADFTYCVYSNRERKIYWYPVQKKKKKIKLRNPNIIMQWHSILMKVTDGYSFCYPITADVQPRCILYKHANSVEPFL